MSVSKIIVPKVWRSEVNLLVAFTIFSFASAYLSRRFPGSLISGRLFGFYGTEVMLTIPLFWFIPFFTLMLGILRIYNVKYIIDSRGLEARVGILSPHRLYQRRVSFADIRSAETEQTIIERVLNVGDVEIGTAATADVEIVFAGVSAPQELQGMIQRERDRSLHGPAVAQS